MKRPGSRLLLGAAFAAVALAATLAVGYFVFWRGGLPRPGSAVYGEMVTAFSVGVAALDVESNDVARERLEQAATLVPEEPAAWANLGLLRIRLGEFDEAAQALLTARDLAPENGEIERFLGLLESRRGGFAEAVEHLRRAIELNPDDLRARYSLAQEVERQGGPEGEAEALRLMGEILERSPDNLVALLERARLAVKLGEAEILDDTIEQLGRQADTWPPRAQEQLDSLREAAATDLRSTVVPVTFLRNVLLPTLPYQQSYQAVSTAVGVVGEPIHQFLRLTPPPPSPAPPDLATSFEVLPWASGEARTAAALLVMPSVEPGPPALLAADAREVWRVDQAGAAFPFPGAEATPPSARGLLAADLNSDSRLDLVLAGAGGVRLYHQTESGDFEDVTEATGLEPDVLNRDAFGAWAADVEMDGDLDIVVGSRTGDPLVLRNNGDGTYTQLSFFEGAGATREFVWADLDQDGDPDAVILDDQGALHVFTNDRAGRFRRRPPPDGLGALSALTVADLDSDGVFDLVGLTTSGELVRAFDQDWGESWGTARVVSDEAVRVGDAPLLIAADLDNNGALDLVVSGASGTWVGLGDGSGDVRSIAPPGDFRVFAATDLDGDGRLDLAGLSADGRPARGIGEGARSYHWQMLRPRAAQAVGDGRINSFGVGGEIEVRAGLLVQKQVIAGPTVHFGLGEHTRADVARIVWPNGTLQAEFETEADEELVTLQRLKGSCPFLFAFDGNGIRFVTDFIWRSPLGLRINAQDTAGVGQTEDWVKIRGDQLAPRDDGLYDLRITAELWETHYWDHVALMVVDHPVGTEVFVDERFARTPPRLEVHPTGPPVPVARAIDDQGQDVTDIVAARDGRYLDTFGRGQYQGVTRDHWVEIEIGDDAPDDQPLWLVAHGWIHPTDSSINVAIAQGSHEPPRGLSLEVPTTDGGWTVAQPDLGFPSGKNKTILVNLDGVFPPNVPRRLRLRTNLEIYWDELAVAPAAPEAPLRTQRLAPVTADLQLRGYSLMTQADASSPELPDYDVVTGTAQRWRDLIGYHTRFGDVRELLEQVDDRYVIANAGDELILRFEAPPPPEEGWVRDFVVVGDGWNKDGDYNTGFSKTVLPLPMHGLPDYNSPPGPLEEDPAYRSHPEDWLTYHTRYVTPHGFQNRLRPPAVSRPRPALESNP